MRKMLYLWLFLPFFVWGLTGGVHYGSAFVLGILCILTWGFVEYSSGEYFKRRIFTETSCFCIAPYRGMGILGWGLLLMIGVTLVTLIPLPDAVLSFLSPMAWKLYGEVHALLGEEGWGYLTASRGRTLYGLFHLCGFFAVYTVFLRLGESQRFLRHFGHMLALMGGIGAVWVLSCHFGVPLSFGATGTHSAFHIGRVANANHASGVFVLLSLCALGAIFNKRHQEAWARRGLWAFLYVIFGVCVIVLQSRAALFSWLFGHVFFACFEIMRRRECRIRFVLGVLCGLFVVSAVAGGLASSSLTAIQNEMAETALSFDGEEVSENGLTSKTQIYGDFPAILRDWPMGIGRSSFGDVYPAYQSFWYAKRFRHVENEYLELILEYGLFFGILFVVLFLVSLVRWGFKASRESEADEIVVGLVCGLAAIGLQNGFDFGLRYWTVGFVFFASAGVVDGRFRRFQYGRKRRNAGVLASNLDSGAFDAPNSGEAKALVEACPTPEVGGRGAMGALPQWRRVFERISNKIRFVGVFVYIVGVGVCVWNYDSALLWQSDGGIDALRAALLPVAPIENGDNTGGNTGQARRLAENAQDLRQAPPNQGAPSSLSWREDFIDLKHFLPPSSYAQVRRGLRDSACSDQIRVAVGRQFSRRGERVDGALRQQLWAEARRWYESALARAPKTPRTRLLLGKICEGMGDLGCAQTQYLMLADACHCYVTSAMTAYSDLSVPDRILPTDPVAQEALVQALIAQEKTGEASGVIEKIADNTRRAKLFYMLYRHLGYDALADAVMESLLARVSESRPLQFALVKFKAESFIQRKMYRELIAYLEEIEPNYLSDSEYWRYRLYGVLWYGTALGTESYRRKATELLIRVYPYRQTSRQWKIAYALGQAKFGLETKRYGQARRFSEEVLRIDAKNREAVRILEALEVLDKRENGEKRFP